MKEREVPKTTSASESLLMENRTRSPMDCRSASASTNMLCTSELSAVWCEYRAVVVIVVDDVDDDDVLVVVLVLVLVVAYLLGGIPATVGWKKYIRKMDQ